MKIRIVANAHGWGGGEMSVCTIMRMLAADGHDVTLHPTRSANEHFQSLPGVSIGPKFAEASRTECEVLFFYANDFVYGLRDDKEHWRRFHRGADRRVMCLNFDIGQAADPWFRRQWRRILFLNRTKEGEFPRCGIPTVSLAPAVDLAPYLKVQPDYGRLHLIRHSKRVKHCDDEVRLVQEIEGLAPEAHFWFMGPPPLIKRNRSQDPWFHLFREFEMPAEEFLQNGSVFWYRLAPRMRDQGPRVVVEAMAAGLPCMVDDRDGAKDRVTSETGWKCRDNEDYLRRCG